MAEILHDFVSAKSDGGDSSLVRPSDWNAAHVLTENLANYSADNYPPTVALSDEFDDGTVNGAWAWSGTTPGTFNETEFPGWLYVVVPTAAATGFFRRTFQPGATDFTVVTKARVGFDASNSVVAGAGIALLNSSDAAIWQIGWLGGASGVRWVTSARVIDTVGTNTPVGGIASQEIYLMIRRTSGNVYTGYISFDGMVWSLTNSSTVATTVDRVALYNNTNLASTYTNCFDFVRCFSSLTFKIGA